MIDPAFLYPSCPWSNITNPMNVVAGPSGGVGGSYRLVLNTRSLAEVWAFDISPRRQRVLDLHDAGKGIGTIAIATGYDNSSVRRILKENGRVW